MAHTVHLQAPVEKQPARNRSCSVLYPTMVSSNSPDAVKTGGKQDAGYPLHAFKKASNVCSLRMVADIKTCSAPFSSNSSHRVETRRGMTLLSYVCYAVNPLLHDNAIIVL